MRMPDGVSFDELNKLYEADRDGDLRSMPFEQYFGEMELSEEQKNKRIETAKDIHEFMNLAIASMYLEWQEGAYDYMAVAGEISRDYQSMLDRMGIPLTAYFALTHVDSVASEIVLATMMHSDDPYFFSDDRARLIAESEANSIWNDSEFEDAIATGKVRKTWHAIVDKATRDSHRAVNGTTIPIYRPFEVGDSLMQFPHDESLGAGPEEIVNCRCSVTYH